MNVAYICEICQREIKREDLAGLEEILARKERLTTRGVEGIIRGETVGKRMVMIPFCHECHAEIWGEDGLSLYAGNFYMH